MLGNISQLCATFFHANSWEAGVKVCLHWPSDASGTSKAQYRDLSAEARDKVRKCSKSQVAVIARLVQARADGLLATGTIAPVRVRIRAERTGAALRIEAAGGGDEEAVSLYVARYANCYRGNTDVNRHAEEFLFEDTKLLEKVMEHTQASTARYERTASGHDGGGVRLVLYMTYQPCHHSGGRVPKEALARLSYATAAPQHPTTCSERILKFYLEELRPRGIGLELVLADVYKATWEEGLHPSEVERRVYATKAQSAREGMRMLLSAGVTMRSMAARDWAFLISLCDTDVQAAFARRGTGVSPFTRMHMGLRHAMDAYLARHIVTD